MESNQNNIPEVKLGQYKGLAVTRHVRGLSEKTLDIEMVHQTRLHASYHNSEEGAKRGSRVLLDFAGFMDGKEIPDSRMEKVMVVLGDGKLMPAAEDAIYGHKAGRPSGSTSPTPPSSGCRSFPARRLSSRSSCTRWPKRPPRS